MDRNVLRWKWHRRCTSHQLGDKDPGGHHQRGHRWKLSHRPVQLYSSQTRGGLHHTDLQTGPLRSGLASGASFWVPASVAFLVAATGNSWLRQPGLWKTAATLMLRDCWYFLLRGLRVRRRMCLRTEGRVHHLTHLNPPALLITFNERVWPNCAHQELGAKEWQADVLQHLQIRQNPLHHSRGLFRYSITYQNQNGWQKPCTFLQLTWGSCGRRSWMLYLTQAITALKTCSSLRTLSSSLEIISISWLAGSSMNSSLSMTCDIRAVCQQPCQVESVLHANPSYSIRHLTHI